jgi:hypothetical protein
MDDLIAALQIFRKYTDADSPLHCEHDTLLVCVDPTLVSDEDRAALDRLGFFVGGEYPDVFTSFRFGSA